MGPQSTRQRLARTGDTPTTSKKLVWPAQSPDLNPIENLWKNFKKTIFNISTNQSRSQRWKRHFKVPGITFLIKLFTISSHRCLIGCRQSSRPIKVLPNGRIQSISLFFLLLIPYHLISVWCNSHHFLMVDYFLIICFLFFFVNHQF